MMLGARVKNDGHIKGSLLVCAKEMTPQTKISTKDKQYTLVGLNILNEYNVMCVVMLVGKREKVL